MDLRAYYQRIREIEGGLEEEVLLVSLDTPDGGKSGVQSEAPRRVAARMIAEGRARAATEDETRRFRERKQEAFRAAEEASAASRVQIVFAQPETRRSGKSKEQG